MVLNGIEVQSLEHLEELIKDMDEASKAHLRNIFNESQQNGN